MLAVMGLAGVQSRDGSGWRSREVGGLDVGRKLYIQVECVRLTACVSKVEPTYLPKMGEVSLCRWALQVTGFTRVLNWVYSVAGVVERK